MIGLDLVSLKFLHIAYPGSASNLRAISTKHALMCSKFQAASPKKLGERGSSNSMQLVKLKGALGLHQHCDELQQRASDLWFTCQWEAYTICTNRDRFSGCHSSVGMRRNAV